MNSRDLCPVLAVNTYSVLQPCSLRVASLACWWIGESPDAAVDIFRLIHRRTASLGPITVTSIGLSFERRGITR